MNKGQAEKVARALLSCAGKLDESVGLLRHDMDEEGYLSYRREIGEIMGLLYIDILRPIFAQYPELEPETMR